MLGLVLEMLNYYSERWSTLVIYLLPRLLSHLRGVSSGAPALERLWLNYLEDQKTPYKFQLSSGLPSPPSRRNWGGHIILIDRDQLGECHNTQIRHNDVPRVLRSLSTDYAFAGL